MSQYPQLVEAIVKMKAAGALDEQIKTDLKKAGWTEEDISQAYVSLPPIVREPVSPLTESPQPPPPLVDQTPPPPTPAWPTETAPARRGHRGLVIGLLIFFLLIALAGGAFAYLKFSSSSPGAPYDESNFTSGLLQKMSEINSAEYTLSSALYTEAREADAEPFNIVVSERPDFAEQYERDRERFQAVEDILWQLRSHSIGNNNTYPQTLAGLNIRETNDPLTGSPYQYRSTDQSRDFNLIINLETDEAVRQARRLSDQPTRPGEDIDDSVPTIEINDRKIILSKKSPSYYYLPAEQKSLFERLAEGAAYLPPEIDVDSAITVAVNNGDWRFNLDGTGDLGDLTYRFNLDALKVVKTFYGRINNLPGIFFFDDMLPPKGQWVKWTPSEDNNFFLPVDDMEESYKENKDKLVAFVKEATRLADEEGLIAFKAPVRRETVADGRSLYRYELGFRREVILPFFERLTVEANEQNLTGDFPVADEVFLDYLRSDEFLQVFNYYDQNTKLILWMDSEGYPALVEYSVRIVPPAGNQTLADKQIMLVLKLSLKQINQPIKIEAPTDAKTLEEIYNPNPQTDAPSSGESGLTEQEQEEITRSLQNR
ncbi:MAG: hypothetical protein WDZ85_01770 [Candidatus Paceibacterota bacterium]